MPDQDEKFTLGLNLDDYRVDARHYPAMGHAKWIDYNYVQGVDYSWRCPAWQYSGFDAYGVAGRCNIVYSLLQGKLDYASPSIREIAYQDLMCGSCDVGAKRNLDFEMQLMLESLRVRLVELGYGPMPEHLPITENIQTSGNRFGSDPATRHDWLPASVLPTPDADILYFVGCRAAFTDQEISRSTACILSAADAPFRLDTAETCCGHYLYVTGQLEKARKVAESNLERIRESGVKTVVFSCAECYKTFKVDYPKMLGFGTADLGFEVKHITELAEGWIQDGAIELKNPVPKRVTYHDPCNLGRMSEPWIPWEGTRGEWGRLNPPRTLRRGYHGVYQAPRSILSAIEGLELVEMTRHHENSFCCGASAGITETNPKFAGWTASERLAEAASTGAETVVSGCPGCKQAFNGANQGGMEVIDITQLLARAIGCRGGGI